jgi:hypothetical protein
VRGREQERASAVKSNAGKLSCNANYGGMEGGGKEAGGDSEMMERAMPEEED